MAEAESQRLAKVVAALVPCSRSQAEQYIAEGWVRVDGERVEEPQHRVTAHQRVEVDRHARLQPVMSVTLLVHKPAGMRMAEAQASIAAASHWDGDTSGIRRVKSHTAGLVALLPLPDAASGLVVFSQDRGVVRKLTQDAALIEQELVADVVGTIADGGLERMARGQPPARVSWQSETRLRIAAKGIAAERVESMCAQAGLELTALRRLRIGRVSLSGLPPGRWRYLPAHERF
jgi:23S rRNA pseudouridine2604 synthase